MKETTKKIYTVPETTCEQSLGLMGILMDSSEFAKDDGTPGEFTAPKRKVF